jgi:hypothetical protein
MTTSRMTRDIKFFADDEAQYRVDDRQVDQGEPDGGKAGKGGVVLLVGEDSLAKTVRPRLAAAGADLTRIAVLPTSTTLPDDLPVVKEAARKVEAKLFVTDPLMAFLGPDANADFADTANVPCVGRSMRQNTKKATDPGAGTYPGPTPVVPYPDSWPVHPTALPLPPKAPGQERPGQHQNGRTDQQ